MCKSLYGPNGTHSGKRSKSIPLDLREWLEPLFCKQITEVLKNPAKILIIQFLSNQIYNICTVM